MINILPEKILKALKEVSIEKTFINKLTEKNIEVVKTQNEKFGDYASNILMVLKKQNINIDYNLLIDILNKEEFVNKYIESINYISPGFLNFKVNQNYLIKELNNYLSLNHKHFWCQKPLKYLIEHTSPNTNKALHIGHLRNNVYAMSVYRLLNLTNNKVFLDCVYNDRGIHICKAIWGYLKNDNIDNPIKEAITLYKKNKKEWWSPESEKLNPDVFVEKCYKIGVLNENNVQNKEELQWLLIEWENNNKIVREVWSKLNKWAHIGFKKTYKLLKSIHHYNWYESFFYKQSKHLIKDALQKGIFVKLPDGAILSDLKNYNLPDTILQRSDGTSMYFTQDIYLTKMKINKFHVDKYVWVVGKEQDLHFNQLFAICDQMKIGNLDKFLHLNYGYVFWKDGKKMSSREGNVVSINELINETTKRINLMSDNQYKSLNNLKENKKEEVILKLALGAIKYAMLKMDHSQDMYFDFEEILNIKNNGSPYIQYTYARISSVLKQGKINSKKCDQAKIITLNTTEREVLGNIIHFNEEILKASKTFSPHILINYLYDLVKSYNNFYEKNKILTNDKYQYQRILISQAVFNIIKLSLDLLGIEVIEKL